MVGDMATLAPPRPNLDLNPRTVLTGLSWDQYEALVDDLEADGRRFVSTFSDGVLEIFMPSEEHEFIKVALIQLLVVFARRTRTQMRLLGSPTYKLPEVEKALEPDVAYSVGKGRSKGGYPNLAIEVDRTNSSVPREPIYALMGTRELWRWVNDQLKVMTLVKGVYVEQERSALVPHIDLVALAEFTRKMAVADDDLALLDDWEARLKSRHP